jgi:uncharacterized protein (DUF1778 family)
VEAFIMLRKTESKATGRLKGTKIQIRLRPSQKTVLARAAELRQMSLSQFMLEYAFEAAQQILAEQVDIVLSAKDWDAFLKALDAPPRPIPALVQLFRESSTFHGPRKTVRNSGSARTSPSIRPYSAFSNPFFNKAW